MSSLKTEENYHHIFYDDNGEPVVKKWLNKEGITGIDQDDLYGELEETFVKLDARYKHNKIQYEKYIWTGFQYNLLNYVKRKKWLIKINVSMTNFDVEDFASSSLCVDDIFFDLNYLFEKLSIPASWILGCILFERLTVREIKKLGIYNSKRIERAVIELRKVFEKYMKFELCTRL